jgi:V8-like Glu-specific endopeptidase
MNRTLLVALVVTASLGCAFADGDTRVALSQPIINGATARDAPWAVMVVQQPAGSTRVRLCTGTVIAPRAVLTAKHCVYRDLGTGTWEVVPASDLTARIGTDFRDAMTRTVAVDFVRTTDGPYRDGDGRNGGDIAVLITREDLGITPRAVSRTPAVEGSAVEIVGYGYTMAGASDPADLGVVHRGMATVARVETNVFSTTGSQWTCTGDSGGPALDGRGALVGVTSIGPTGCRVSTSYYTRVDRYVSLFEDLLPPATTTDAGVPADALGTSDVPAVATDGAALPPATGGSDSGCHASPGASSRGGVSGWWLVLLAAWARSTSNARPSSSRR